MSTNPALVALRRLPVIFLLVAALLLTALFMLEGSGGIEGPDRSGVELPFVNTKADKAPQGNDTPAHCTDGRGNDGNSNPNCTGAGNGNGGGNGGGQSNGNHQKHCTDGKGQDFEKNPHCRDISGAR